MRAKQFSGARQKSRDALDEAERFSFADAPEVKDLLEGHLDTTRDPSLAIRSVCEQWFPWFVLLDRVWAADNVVRILPATDEDGDYWRAAWNTYVTFNPPYNNVAAVLRDQYTTAVRKLDARVSHQCRGRPAQIVGREAEAAPLSETLHSLLTFQHRTVRGAGGVLYERFGRPAALAKSAS